ncbi:MAG: hypothetical protein IMW89_22175, partial [Ktedonobacteraceae bacterium]|nr:hypothetical protein [Ktedonobacteraceae bacterium]
MSRKQVSPSPPARMLKRGLLATAVALCLLLLTTVTALANTVHVYDRAGVLDDSRVQSEAQSLPKPVDIYTMSGFNGTMSSFNQEAVRSIRNSDMIVIAIDTSAHHLAIVGGKNVGLSNSQYQDAVKAFSSNYRNGDYTGATIAALRSLNNALGGSGLGGVLPGAGGSIFNGTTLCCLGLIVLALIAVFVFARRRRGGFGGFGRFGQPTPPPAYGPPYNQYGNQYGNYPPNYGPGNQGMNP